MLKHLKGMTQLREIGLDDTGLENEGLEDIAAIADSMELEHIERYAIDEPRGWPI